PTPKHLLEEFHALGWLVLEGYGLSENVLPMAMNRVDDFRFGTVGRPMRGNEIVVIEGEAIKVRGPGLFGGYLVDEDLTPFDAEGFFLTGDLGKLDDDGFLRVTGRSGDMIKTSTGRRVAPAGAEAQLRRVPGIDQALLVGNGRKCLVALCSCTQTGFDAGARTSLAAALRQQVLRISEHERPLGIALIERPFCIEMGELTTNLKFRRSEIEARHGDLIRMLYARIDDSTNSAVGELLVLLPSEV
ncbi:MAG: AMP-binding protein, partial [Cryobacterium sp.]|nr:AMP-binding protein [Cryobacterium sp.]